MNNDVVLKWECDDCKTVNQCTIGELRKDVQWCSKCNTPHCIEVKINVGKMFEFKNE